MKTRIAQLFLCLVFASCGNSSNDSQTAADTAEELPSTPGEGHNATTAPFKPVVDNYLKLKNALAGDKSDDAATAAKSLLASIDNIDTTAIPSAQKANYAELAEDMREHAQHTADNAGNIAHQREHFDLLSKDVYDLVKTFGGGQTLYYTHCPMAFNSKGANWVSETKEIKNPYFGSKMLECGEVKEELK